MHPNSPVKVKRYSIRQIVNKPPDLEVEILSEIRNNCINNSDNLLLDCITGLIFGLLGWLSYFRLVGLPSISYL